MKKIILLLVVFLFTLVVNTNIISASIDEKNIDEKNIDEKNIDENYIVEDFILRDPITNKYSSDWSHLDTPENIQLQKEVQNYFLGNTTKTQSRQIQGADGADDLNKRIDDFLSSVYPDIDFNASENTISPMASYDIPGKVEKAGLIALEGRILLVISNNLTPSNIASSHQNATAARDHGSRYAENNNYYSNGKLITWDNTADTLRHFAWNYMNSNDSGVTKAKAMGDGHELALIAYKYMNDDRDTASVCKYAISCMQTMAIQKTLNHYDLAKGNFTSFNNIFDNSSVMDLLNNSKGRLAYSQGNATYSVPFNRMLSNGELIKTPNSIFSSQRRTAWNEF